MGLVASVVRGLAGVPAGVEAKSFPSWVTALIDGVGETGLDRPVGVEEAAGLPAWLSVVNRLAGGYSMCPLIVYEGAREARSRATGSWQWELLHDRPGDGRTPAMLQADIAASLAAAGNAYLLKVKVRGRVRELVPLDPRDVTPEREAGRVVFRYRPGGAAGRVYTTSDVIPVRGAALPGCLAGAAPLQALRQSMRTGLRRQRWEASYFKNDARPGVVLKFPERLGVAQATQWREAWNAQHQGSHNAGKAAALGGGADIVTIPPISLADAQFVEAERLTVTTLAGLYGVPLSLLGLEQSANPEADSVRFVTWGLGPMATAVEQALRMDEDLFPRGSGLTVETLFDGLLRTTTKDRYDAYRLARQGGWMAVNEARVRENLPAVDGGDTVQLTPVGGAVDRTAPADTAPVDGGEREDEDA